MEVKQINEAFNQLPFIMDTKNKDGSYNRLMQTNSQALDNDQSFRDNKVISLGGDNETPNTIEQLLVSAYNRGASDVHIVCGAPPKIRLNGELLQTSYNFLKPFDCEYLLTPLLTDDQKRLFEENGDLDFAYSIKGVCRFRVNMFKQQGTMGAVFRALSMNIPSADSLGVPKSVQDLASKKRGLVLVTGPTGSGKSTTLASLINIINETRRENIITLEDPIEYVHNHKMSTIVQREMGLDSKSFASGIRAALREDPDVILIGEMRDPETIQIAITAAETGHLVFSTLHTIGAAPTIDRIVDSFPSEAENQIRVQLATVLEGVVSQQLIPTSNGEGRVAAFEVMLASPEIRELIRKNNTKEIDGQIKIGKKQGMISMDDSLMTLYFQDEISAEKTVEFAINKSEMASKVGL